MSKFLRFILIFLVSFSLVLYSIQLTFWGKPAIFKIVSYHLATDVYNSIYFSQKQTSKKKLFFGDSVSKLLFGQGEGQSFFSLSATQAITMIGQYINLVNYCSINEIDTAILVYHPSSFQNNLDLKYTYAHLIKPYYVNSNHKYFTRGALNLIYQTPYIQISQIPFVKMSNWNPYYDFKEDLDYNRYFLSEISTEYLLKIKDYCDSHHIEFLVISPPLKESFKTLDTIGFARQIKDAGLGDEFKYYLSSLEYMPDTCFHDQMHFKIKYKNLALAKTLFK